MANENQYQFPMVEAIQCIPEFKGSSDELEPFLGQIDYFAAQLPAGTSQKPLLNVVLMKLKGNASTFINRIKSDSWNNMKPKLKEIFGKHVTAEEIIQQIETLEQDSKESFKDYAERALTIKDYLNEIETQEDTGQASFAEKCLKIHFIGGLKDENLKQTSKVHRKANFEELIKELKEVNVECEQISNIEKRLHSCRMNNFRNKGFDEKRDYCGSTNQDGDNYQNPNYYNMQVNYDEYNQNRNMNYNPRKNLIMGVS